MNKLLIIGANTREAVVLSALVDTALPGGANRLFLDQWNLGALIEIPAFQSGARETVILDMPTPAIANQPQRAREALEAGGARIRWISHHPLDEEECACGLELIETGDESLWQALSSALDLDSALPDQVSALLEKVPEELPLEKDTDFALAWRFCIEAACQEPWTLGAVTRELTARAVPDPALVSTGRALFLERRELARESSFHSFPMVPGSGVMVMAPRAAFGHYIEVAREVRRHQQCDLSVLSFDSGDFALLEYESRPLDFNARLERLTALFPGMIVRGFHRSGIALRGPQVGELEFLEQMIATVSEPIH